MADTITVLEVQDMDVFIEGKGSETIVMVHGWPDTWRLWDGQVELLKKNYRCVRFSLPGFDIAKKRRHYTGQQVIDAIAAVVDQVSPKGKVTLMLHDWGCVYGYQYYMQHQDRVSRIVGVDVGDARSKHMKLPLKMVLFSAAYQLYLVKAWIIGGPIGNWMTRLLAGKLFKVKADIKLIHAGMNYSYYNVWKHVLLRKPQPGFTEFVPACPMLFVYGKIKPTMFHSQHFVDTLNGSKGSRAVGFDGGHWLMLDKKEEFNAELLAWLSGKTVAAKTAPATKVVKKAAAKTAKKATAAKKAAPADKKPVAKKASAKKVAAKATTSKPATSKKAVKKATSKTTKK